MSDYNELNLYLYENDCEATLYVHMKDKSMLAFHNVRHDPIRHNGWWVISHKWFEKAATSHVPAENVLYFTTIDEVNVTENVTLDECTCGHGDFEPSWHVEDCPRKNNG